MEGSSVVQPIHALRSAFEEERCRRRCARRDHAPGAKHHEPRRPQANRLYRIARLQKHLTTLGAWSDDEQAQMQQAVEQEVLAAQKVAEGYGTLASGHVHDASTMFEDVYKDMPPHLRDQMRQAAAQEG